MSDTDLALIPEFEQPSRETWLGLVAKVLEGADYDQRLVSRTADGLAVQPLYARSDAAVGAQAVARSAYFPGGWDVRQHHAEPDPKAANAAILEDLEGGATSLVLQVAAPGQWGLPYSADGLSTALKGVFLDGCGIALDARENTMDAAGSLIEIWRGAGINENNRRGAFNYDPLGTLARNGTLYYPAQRSCEIAAKFAYDCRTMSHVAALLADGRPYHDAGAGEAQELAVMLATLVAYLRACETAGLRPRYALAKVGLALSADADLFLTIAKLRAARKLVQRVADACGASHAADTTHLWAATSQRMMARRDPWVNMLRTTIACTGAALGGADAITVLPYTWALGKPDPFARRIARNTHLVLQEESSLGRVMDPAHGAWFIERMTEDMAKSAWTEFQEIEARGGIGAALESGFIQDRIAETARARSEAVATGREKLTGVSAFPRLADDGVKVAPHPSAEAVIAGGTSVTALPLRRPAEPFELLRDAADAHAAATGQPPRIFLACLGEPASYSARATWTRNFLAAGGIEAVAGDNLHASGQAGKAFADSGLEIACICAADAVYAELAEATAAALKSAGARQVLVAGRPGRMEAALTAAGVDSFIFAGGNALSALSRIQVALGIRGPLRL